MSDLLIIKKIMEKLELTELEKLSFLKGIATQRVRLKAGRLIWDEITKDLLPITGFKCQDADRITSFKERVAKLLFYEKLALKEWLRAQIEAGCADVLDSDVEQSKQIDVYKMHLEAISPAK